MFQTGPIVYRFRGLLGIPVEIGQTLAFLVGLYVVLSFSGGADPVWLVSFIAMALVTIYLHELGHGWACKVQGVPVRRIVLHGAGGFCEYTTSPSRHKQEFIVAMGPVVNLALWALASLGAHYVWSSASPSQTSFYLGYYLDLFAKINIFLFIFNLLPVQPLDGGKLFQLIMLRFLPPMAAMRVTGAVGLVTAVLWWPLLIWVWMTSGWILLFAPSISTHYQMMRGELRF